MTQNNALTTTATAAMIPDQNEWSIMRDMASQLVPTRFLPETIKTPEQAVAIMLKGRELRVPPMYALSNIVIVKGKPTVSAEMMLALIYRDYGKQAIRIKHSDNERCTVEYRTEGWDGTSEYTFAIEDARKANLFKNDVWNQYPAAMLRARAISAVARMAFPESIGGMYVPGELGDAVTVNADGEVIGSPIETNSRVVDAHVSTHNGSEWEDGYDLPPAPNVTQLAPQNADPERAMKRVHAAGAAKGITHEMLHAWATSDGRHQSLTEVSPERLDTLAKRIEDADMDRVRLEWGRYGWTSAVNQETGEIIDADYIDAHLPDVRPDLPEIKKSLWTLAHDTFGWSKDDLDLVTMMETGVHLSGATASQLTTVYATLVVMGEDERTAVLDTARAAAAA